MTAARLERLVGLGLCVALYSEFGLLGGLIIVAFTLWVLWVWSSA